VSEHAAWLPEPLVGAMAPPLAPGVLGFTTGRAAGSFGLGSTDPVADVIARWDTLQQALVAGGISRLCSGAQVHGARLAHQHGGWSGWLRARGVDGHVTTERGTALVVTVADCTPVFLAHPAGAVAALHAGWRGTAAGILDAGFALLTSLGFPADECAVHLGPAICGSCYEVGPEVLTAVHGRAVAGKGQLDVRAVLAEQAVRRGVGALTVSSQCTRCDNGLFFSHRAGDAGRQLGVLVLQ